MASIGTIRVPVSQLHTIMQQGHPIMGISFTMMSSDIALTARPYHASSLLTQGSMLQATQLQDLLHQHACKGVVLGGTALFKADGSTHYGVRKLISGVMGVVYESDWLPKAVPGHGHIPIWLCREGIDDPVAMLTNYIQVACLSFVCALSLMQKHSKIQL